MCSGSQRSHPRTHLKPARDGGSHPEVACGQHASPSLGTALSLWQTRVRLAPVGPRSCLRTPHHLTDVTLLPLIQSCHRKVTGVAPGQPCAVHRSHPPEVFSVSLLLALECYVQ